MPDGDVAAHAVKPEKGRQSRAANPQLSAVCSMPHTVGFTIELLGRRLGMLHESRRGLGAAEFNANPSKSTARGLGASFRNTSDVQDCELRQVTSALKAVEDSIDAVEQLILASRAETPQDAVIQLTKMCIRDSITIIKRNTQSTHICLNRL